jgi:hypothetical protein
MAESTVIEALRVVVQEATGLELDSEVFASLVENETVVAEAAQWGVGDTVIREEAMDLVMLKLIGQRWPLYGDGFSDDELNALVESTQAAHDRLIPVGVSQ